MSRKLTGKVALVTGGSRGIGAAIAKRLGQDGADVAFSYYSSADMAELLVKDIRHEGVRVAAFQADQADADQAEKLVKTVVEKFGGLDILICNAATLVIGAVDDPFFDRSAFERQFVINVTSIGVTVRAAVKFMKPGGRIVLIGSVNAEHVACPCVADYSATKSALIGYIKGWTRDLGHKNITVNLVQPGPIDTDMNPDTPEFPDVLKAQTALGRFGQPKEVAAAVAFLASPEASYITGSILNVDGGFCA